jgi:hypothetical protein
MSDSQHSLNLSPVAPKSVYTINVTCTDDSQNDTAYTHLNVNRNIILSETDLKIFNKRFDEVHLRDERGYGTWLSDDTTEGDKDGDISDEDSKNVETNIVDPDFNKKFDEKVVSGSHIDTVVLHPEQMATLSGITLGVNIKDDMSSSEVFTSMMNEHPEFTDVYSAFTHDNTMSDKIAAFDESTRPQTLEELIAEREATVDLSITPETIVAFEKKKLEEELERQTLLREHFDPTGSERKWLTNNSFLHDFSSTNSKADNTVVDS